MMVTSGMAGPTSARPWNRARLKFGMTETTRSGRLPRQYFGERAALSGMIQANDAVHHRHEILRAQRPAALEQRVVHILHADACVLAEDVERLENLLEIDEFDLPVAPLVFDDGFERSGGASMAAAGIERRRTGCASWTGVQRSAVSDVRTAGPTGVERLARLRTRRWPGYSPDFRRRDGTGRNATRPCMSLK